MRIFLSTILSTVSHNLLFSFREIETKDGIVDNPENQTVTYQIRKFWHFVPEMSHGSLDDLVTTINLPILVRPGIIFFVEVP